MCMVIFFIFIVIIGALILYMNIFPLAKPIELPMENEVYAIEIEKENTMVKYIDDGEIVEILKIISNTKPTRIITAHERPMIREYITINFNTKEDRLYPSYIYNKNSKWYIEQPYIGVYEIKKGLLDFLPYIEPLNQKKNTKQELADLIPMVMIKGKLYLDTGKESDISGRCGVMDGEITSTVEPFEKPTQDNQSNFGSGYEYQFVDENSIDIYMNGKWMRFEKEMDKAYDRINEYMKEESIAVFSPYYELLDFQISNYVEKNIDESIEATFFYKIIYKNYDKDPDTVEYIKQAKESGNKNYQQMYDEYLEPKEMNFDLKVVIDKNDIITLYSNVSPNGIEWEKTDMSDFIIGR